MKTKLLAIFLLPMLAIAQWQPTIKLSPSGLDAFSRLPVGEPFTVFDSVFSMNTLPAIYEPLGTNALATVTHLPFESSASFANSSNNYTLAMQTYQYTRYIPGKSTFWAMTTVLPAASTNAGMAQTFGLFDRDNGLFFTRSSGVMGVGIRSRASGTVVDTIVNQSSWNIDKLDGTGPSGRTLDPTIGNIYWARFQWLGYGKVTFGYDYDGEFHPCHSFDHAGSNQVYMSNANLPVRYELKNGSNGALTNQMKGTCATVIVEGGNQQDLERGLFFEAVNSVDLNINATETHLISLRPAITFNSLTNRSTIVPNHYELSASANSQYAIVYGATLSAGTWYQPDPNSAVEICTNGTYTVGTGRQIEVGFVSSGAGVNSRGQAAAKVISRLPIALDAAGTNQSRGVTVIMRTFSGNGTARGSVAWEEIR